MPASTNRFVTSKIVLTTAAAILAFGSCSDRRRSVDPTPDPLALVTLHPNTSENGIDVEVDVRIEYPNQSPDSISALEGFVITISYDTLALKLVGASGGPEHWHYFTYRTHHISCSPCVNRSVVSLISIKNMNDNWQAAARPTSDLAKLFFERRGVAPSSNSTTIRFFSDNEEANMLIGGSDQRYTPELQSAGIDFGQGYDGLSCDTLFGPCIPSVRYVAGAVSR